MIIRQETGVKRSLVLFNANLYVNIIRKKSEKHLVVLEKSLIFAQNIIKQILYL